MGECVCVCGGGGGGGMEYGERKKYFCGLSHNWVATEVLGGPGMNVPLPILAMAFWIKVQGGGGGGGARGGGNRWPPPPTLCLCRTVGAAGA